MGNEHLHALTSLRLFAALAILLQHSEETLGVPFSSFSPIPLYFGVDFFFVLSGFILTFVYADIGHATGARAFYVARIARIWPLHLATLLIWLLVVPRGSWVIPGGEHYVLETTLANIFLLQAWVPLFFVYFSYNAVSWSISTEAFFYLLFPWLGKDWGRTWYWKLGVVVAAVVLILCLCDWAGVRPLTGSNDFASVTTHGIVYISPFTRVFQFVVGMASALVFIRLRQPLLRIPAVVWTGLEVFVLLMIGRVWSTGFVWSDQLFGEAETALGAFTRGVPVTLLFGVIVLVFGLGRGLISKLLSFKPLIHLGEASFALYLIHQILLNPLQVYRDQLSSIPVGVQFCLFLLASVLASIALHQFVEKPCRRVIVKRFGRSNRPAPSAELVPAAK